MAHEDFSETTTSIAAQVGARDGRPCNPDTVRDYADRGWVEYRRLANGTRLFKPSAVDKVRKLRTKRLKNRGRRRAAAALA